MRAIGYEFVLVSDLAGLSRDQAMPLLSAGSRAHLLDGYVFGGLNVLSGVTSLLFALAIGLGIARAIFLSVLGLMNRQRERAVVLARPCDAKVSVLIPAFNEAKVIASSIRRVLASREVELEVIVIDDGSTDGTSGLIASAFGDHPNVKLLTISNGGKARALNVGLAHASGSIVVALDADTQFEPLTIARLARWFSNRSIGAVAGNAKVGNRINMVTRWQALEYISAQNLERRALAMLGSITVVPGAVGAWRRTLLDQLGGFPADTLAEDQDLTIAVLRRGCSVTFDSEAIAWTEAPTNLRSLARQRFRWAFGTLQCLWKHREVFFDRRYKALGMVGMPQAAPFQILFALISPLVDVLFVWQIGRGLISFLLQTEGTALADLTFAAACFAIFSLVDAVSAAVGFVIEKREQWSLLWWLPLQRFGYRQIMYYVVLKSVVRALTGLHVGWGKLERTATVDAMSGDHSLS